VVGYVHDVEKSLLLRTVKNYIVHIAERMDTQRILILAQKKDLHFPMGQGSQGSLFLVEILHPE
jgi:hypothetical protein